MSDLAYQRFMASYMLNSEEQLPENRQEIIDYTEDVLQAKGKVLWQNIIHKSK